MSKLIWLVQYAYFYFLVTGLKILTVPKSIGECTVRKLVVPKYFLTRRVCTKKKFLHHIVSSQYNFEKWNFYENFGQKLRFKIIKKYSHEFSSLNFMSKDKFWALPALGNVKKSQQPKSLEFVTENLQNYKSSEIARGRLQDKKFVEEIGPQKKSDQSKSIKSDKTDSSKTTHLLDSYFCCIIARDIPKMDKFVMTK